MSACKLCMAVIKKNQLNLSCSDCESNFHARCVKMSQADLDYINEQGTVWRCDPCGVVRRKSMRLDAGAQEGALTLEDVMKVLTDIRDEQKRTVQDFNKSYETLYERLEETTNKLQAQIGKIDEYVKRIEELKGENVVLKNKVCELESRVDELEHYSRRNCIEIQGVPESREENTLEIICKIGEALGMTITDKMIDICHRIGKKNEERGPRGIIAKFVRRIDRDNLIQKRREKKRDFSTRHLGLPEDRPIYINDSLSPARRKLLGQARQVKRDKGYKYLWMRGGIILLRKEKNTPALEIKCQADLMKL